VSKLAATLWGPHTASPASERLYRAVVDRRVTLPPNRKLAERSQRGGPALKAGMAARLARLWF